MMELKFCMDCVHFPESNPPYYTITFCNYVKGSSSSVTPYKVIDRRWYASPMVDNLSNECPFFEKKKKKGNHEFVWIMVVIGACCLVLMSRFN